MRTYETMLLFDPRRDDSEIEQAITRFTTLLEERDGEVKNTDRWGRRRLAYEIEDLHEGYYAVVTYLLEPDKRQEVEDVLPFLEGLLRVKTVRPIARKKRSP